MDTTSRIDREREFHDNWAAATPLEKRKVISAFESTTAPENKFILKQMGDLRGKKLLDVGCGLGESSVYFALKGAQVTAMDLSPVMVETTISLGKHFGVEIEGVVGSADTLTVPDGQFDFVYLGNLVHHIEDRPRLWKEVKRVLKPGGSFYSWDPVAYNPVVNVYRRIATSTRTPDEAPLEFEDIKLVKKEFPRLQYRAFWLTSMSLFVKYAIINRVNPNKERYWKKILEEPEESLGWLRALQKVDEWLLKLPGVKWLAWNMVLTGQKPNEA